MYEQAAVNELGGVGAGTYEDRAVENYNGSMKGDGVCFHGINHALSYSKNYKAGRHVDKAFSSMIVRITLSLTSGYPYQLSQQRAQFVQSFMHCNTRCA